MQKVILLLCLWSGLAMAQGNLPFIVGAQLETGVGAMPSSVGAGVVRATPFVGAWIDGIGFVKLGVAYWQASLIDSADVDHGIEQKDLTIQVGSNFGGQGRPYWIASYTRGNSYSDKGDVSWSEWGSGIGGFFELSKMSAILMEAEYRWVGEHYDPLHDLTISGTRIQVHIGFVAYVY